MKRISFTDDCFADAGDSCKVIGDKKCKGCGFYKTQIQLEISKKRALRRLKTLDKPTKLYIARKYKVEGIV